MFLKMANKYNLSRGEIPKNDKSLVKYIDTVCKHPLLSSKRQKELLNSYRAKKDKKALEALILSNMRLVVFIALRYRAAGVPLQDIISEGTIGLIDGINRYDPEHSSNSKISTFVVWHIREKISAFILKTERQVTFPRDLVKLKNSFEKEIGTGKTRSEVIKDIQATDAVKRHLQMILAYDSEKGSQSSLTIMSEHSEQVEESFSSEEKKKWYSFLMNEIEKLPRRQKEAIYIRLIYNDGKEVTFEQIGKEIGATREGARVAYLSALQKLEHKLELAGVREEDLT